MKAKGLQYQNWQQPKVNDHIKRINSEQKKKNA